jgi:vacuolar-type H+-ATPase subunit I/STV1
MSNPNQPSQKPGNANAEKLQKMLGFDPDKKTNITQDALSEAVKEINEERIKEVKARAKELLIKAMQLREQKVKLDREYNQQSGKFDKELGKILKQIEGALSGKSQDEIDEEMKGKDESAA